jgi:transcriptional regulator with PAS, ATPase and Fis domain
MVRQKVFDRSVTVEVLETRRQVSMLQHVQKTGKQLLVTGTPAFDEEGKIYLVVVNERDMTQLNAVRERLDQTLMEREKFKEELSQVNLLELKEQKIVAESESTRQILRVAVKLARLGVSNILILGESGTGKGLLAKFIHENSSRKGKPFIQINCAALPESLLEAELFGYEKGAFTGAQEQGKAGLFELAQGGTLFLDEIGDLPFSVQAKLLKYLDDQEIMRLGSIRPRKIDCIIVAATNRDLEDLSRKRKFRHDLFFRLSTFMLRIAPLRERPEDIFELIGHFLSKYNDAYGVKKRLSTDALRDLKSYPFPGNVRELKSILKQAVVMGETDLIDPALFKSLERNVGIDLSDKGGNRKASLQQQVTALERDTLKDAAARCKSTRELAVLLGISQPSVVRKLKRHGITLSGPKKA